MARRCRAAWLVTRPLALTLAVACCVPLAPACCVPLAPAAGDDKKPAGEKKPDPRVAEWNKKLAAQFDGGDRWAVLVGINKYPQNPLRFCVADARLLADTLVRNCGYHPSRILLLTDDQKDADLRPTKANLQKQLNAFLRKVKEKDTVLVFYGGHGGAIDGQNFLCPIDFDGSDAKLTGWRADEVRTMLHDCKAVQKLLVLDCCHSGAARSTSPEPSGQEVGGAFEHARGLITLAACRKDEEAQEADGNGLFTRSLARGLVGAADFDANGIVDTDELYRYALADVAGQAGRMRPARKQTPVRIIGEDVVGVFALSRPNGEAFAEKLGPAPKPGDAVANSVGMRLVYLPPGLVVLGSPKDEYKRNDDEGTQPVLLGGNMYMGAFEVTQAEYEKVIGKNPSYFAAGGAGAEKVAGLDTKRFPVESVSYEDAVEFCRKLSALPEERKARRAYRLPTDAEWEYACRAGTATVFSSGDRLSPKDANVRGDRPYLDSEEGPWLGRTTAVGSYKPNAFGLYDMHGNVAEWCIDYYAMTPYRATSVWSGLKNGAPDTLERIDKRLNLPQGTAVILPTDPTGPRTGESRVTRGGYFAGEVHFARSAARQDRLPDYRNRSTGFRVVCTTGEPSADDK